VCLFGSARRFRPNDVRLDCPKETAPQPFWLPVAGAQYSRAQGPMPFILLRTNIESFLATDNARDVKSFLSLLQL